MRGLTTPTEEPEEPKRLQATIRDLAEARETLKVTSIFFARELDPCGR